MRKIIAMLFCLTSMAHASSVDELKKRLEKVDTLEGEFTQRVKDSQGQVIQSGGGEFSIKRPGYFYWETRDPFAQIIVGNPQKLWVYDPDLEQVTVQKQNVSDGVYNPSRLLSGDLSGLDTSFNVTATVDPAGARFTLTPKNAQAQYEDIVLQFDQVAPVSFTFSDRLHQVTEIRFTRRDVNRPVKQSRFEFEPPAGTDIVVNE